MRSKLSLLFVMSVVCLVSARAQTVNEKESSIVFKDTAAEVSIVVDNPAAAFDTKLELELLDQESMRRADSSQDLRIKRGKGTYTIPMAIGDLLKTAEGDIAWYRLRYRLGAIEGIISMSELFTDIFELRMAAPENVYPGMNYRVRVRAIQPFTKTAVKNVKIDGEFTIEIDTDDAEDKFKLTAKGETDGKGFATLDFKVPESVKLDEYADGEVKITGRKRGIVRELEADLDSEENRGSVFLMNDKPLYQPGQDFNIRGIYLDANHNVVTNSELEFQIEDEDDTVLYRETVTTSEFGVAAISWQIPENAKLGSYEVTVEADDDDLRRHEMHFKVSRYDLPNFSVTAKADRAFYLPSDKTAKIAVTADYLFGKPVKKGHVRVVQESERRWNWRAQKHEAEEKQVFEGETDAQGKYVASIDLTGELAKLNAEKWKRFEDLKFAAYFTDPDTNRTEQKRLEIRLTKEPIHIYFITRYRNNPNLPIKGYISTFYADGTVAVCDVTISNNGKRVARLRTNSLGAGRFDLDVPAGEIEKENFALQVLAEDKKGQVGTFSDEMQLDKGDAMVMETDKTIYNPGDNIDIRLSSTQKSGYVYVDIVKGWSVIGSHFVNLKNGKGDLRIPYRKDLNGELTIAAYTDDNDDYYSSKLGASRGIIFPAQQNLKLDAKFSADTYRPNEEGTIKFSVLDGNRQTIQSALGVVIFDKAIEERAKTDAEFGGYFSGLYDLMGYDKGFGSLTLKDINELDLSRPVPDEMQLAAEVMLAGNHYYPRITHSNFDQTEARGLYADYFKKQLDPVRAAVKNEFDRSGAYPSDMVSLRKILGDNGIDFDRLRDPWGEKYIASFSTYKTQATLNLKTVGADKAPDTPDDFEVSSAGLSYFTPTGNKIDAAVLDFHARTGGFIRDLPTLETEVAKQGIVLKSLKDRWGRDYRITFEIEGKHLVARFHSNGENGVFEARTWSTDDFDIWTSNINYFAETEARLMQAIGSTLKAKKAEAPQNEAEFRRLLVQSGIDLEKMRDFYNEEVYITSETRAVYTDKSVFENGTQKIVPVTQHIVTFRIRSKGGDRITSGDDFDLTTFSTDLFSLLKERLYSTGTAKDIVYTGASGAIRGTVVDANGAVVPGAQATATSETDETRVFKTETDEEGEFLLEDLPSGRYTVTVSASGFQNYTYTNVQVRAMNLVEMKVYLSIGTVSATVSVTSGEDSINTSSSKVATNVTAVPTRIAFPYAEKNSTPRLREYFPETLVWNPELVTDKNGKAEMKFKMADNITTWKMYSIASTKKGKIGVAEKEVTAFQPFFVDLDPPKFLTNGDEISLPVQIRNYTEKKQKVDISMAKGDWFSFLASGKQQIEVGSGDSQNAVFAFKATEAVNRGKQRVTALAQGDSDAIEKPVTVRPDGEEIVKIETSFFKEAASFDVNFPANALAKTQKAELKIYPNLFSHVAESVEGLLKRPYGCGEQTISSTYPNVMVLKFTKEDSKLRQTAQKYLQKGYERLTGYQVADGGFTYWGGKDTSDVALTAYALRFLNDAKEFIDVDETIVKNARDWLVKQQRTDGSWTKKYYYETTEDTRRTKLFTSYVARTLAMMKEKDTAPLQRALVYLKGRNAEIDEPYAIALYGLASLDAGNTEEAAAIAEILEKMAIAEGGSVYWKLETNTPFYGWGTAGRLETTALVLQLLLRAGKPDEARSALISKGTLFLLRNKDRYGVWYSTQTTINVLDAFLAALAPGVSSATAETVQVLVNGAVVQSLPVAPDRIEPIMLDLQPALGPASNKVEVRTGGASSLMAQVVQAHYIDWKDSESASVNTTSSGSLTLDYKCDKTSAAIMQDITCSVEAERVGFRGYGMLLAEIGTPPGADVSRESLQAAMDDDWAISRYDILPDRIVVYMWAKAGGTRFNFKFRPRYGINAQTPASTVYDYYNPDAKALAVPLRFAVK